MDQFTELIDVPRLIFNSLWVLGLSIISAAISLHHFEAQQKKVPFRQQIQTPRFQLPLWIGLTLVTIGFGGNAEKLWEQLIWIVLTILNASQLYFSYRENREVKNSQTADQ